MKDLFESDLASLNPASREALGFVARYAPVQAGEVTERYRAGVVQSLLDQRLVVQVGEKLDTYWDTFRDYLNTGRVPIEDSYILRQTPASVSRLVELLLAHGGSQSVSEITAAWRTSENVVWNVARELRQLGLASSAPNMVQLSPEIVSSLDIEADLRSRVGKALRRHRAYSALTATAEKHQGAVAISQYAKGLPDVFPAVDVADSTWNTYARVFIAWFEYAGLAETKGSRVAVLPEGKQLGKGSLSARNSPRRGARAFPTTTPGPVLGVLKRLQTSESINPKDRAVARSLQQLVTLGAISHVDGQYVVADGLFNDAKELQPQQLKALLAQRPGGGAALEALEQDPMLSPRQVGAILADAQGTDWSSGTLDLVGKSFRGWARASGVRTARPNGGSSPPLSRIRS